MKCHSYLFLCADTDIAEYLANSFKEWITEGVDVDGVDTADALNLNQEALDAWYNRPDVQERENGKVNAPDECHRDAEDGRQQAVKPIFCHSEGGEAGLPDAVETVCPFWFCNHIFKVNLDHVIVEMLGVAVDQVNLLGVRSLLSGSHSELPQALTDRHCFLSLVVCVRAPAGQCQKCHICLPPPAGKFSRNLGSFSFRERGCP